MSKPDGGSAFPECDTIAADGHLISKSKSGMSLRDYFAAKALQGALSDHRNHADDTWAVIAKASYRAADAMIAARNA